MREATQSEITRLGISGYSCDGLTVDDDGGTYKARFVHHECQMCSNKTVIYTKWNGLDSTTESCCQDCGGIFAGLPKRS